MNDPILFQNEQIAIEILPELGGKLSALTNRKTGRQWLWRNPFLVCRPPIYGESYVENIDFGGWDEMFPSIDPVQLDDGTTIPDHGEIVSLPAEVTPISPNQVAIATRTRAFPVRFTRTLTLDGTSLNVDYLLESEHDQPIPYLWAAHPLIALQSGVTLELPNGDFLTPPDPAIAVERRPDGTCQITFHDPDVDPDTHPVAQKLFIPWTGTSELTLRTPGGSSLKMAWDGREAPWLGLWINLRAWSGCGSVSYFNLGIEPTTAPDDNLLKVIDRGQHRILPPHEKQSWAVRVSLPS